MKNRTSILNQTDSGAPSNLHSNTSGNLNGDLNAKKLRKLKFTNSKGYTLTEVIVAMSIFALAGVALTIIIRQQGAGSASVSTLESKLELARMFNRTIRSLGALQNSATQTAVPPSNTGGDFDHCVNGSGTATDCVSIQAGAVKDHDFYLYNSGLPQTLLLAGPPSAYILYDTKGVRCAAVSATCFLRASASFQAYCPGATLTCKQAQFIRVSFLLEPVPVPGASIGVTSIKPVSGSFSTSLASLAAAGTGTAGYIPYWNASSVLTDSLITQALPGPDISVAADYFQLHGNLDVKPPPGVPFVVHIDSYFYQNLLVKGQMMTGNLLGINPDMSSQFKTDSSNGGTGDATVIGPAGINANVWAGSITVNGNFLCLTSFTAPGFLMPSDRRLKKDVQPIPDAIARIEKMRGVQFNWKESNQLDDGFIAQKVEKIFPELVGVDSRGKMQVEYLNLVAPLSEAVKLDHQKLQTRIDSTDSQIASMNARLAAIRARAN